MLSDVNIKRTCTMFSDVNIKHTCTMFCYLTQYQTYVYYSMLSVSMTQISTTRVLCSSDANIKHISYSYVYYCVLCKHIYVLCYLTPVSNISVLLYVLHIKRTCIMLSAQRSTRAYFIFADAPSGSLSLGKWTRMAEKTKQKTLKAGGKKRINTHTNPQKI